MIKKRLSGETQPIGQYVYNMGPHCAAMPFTRFERARIIGARGLQIAMGAPVLLDIPEEMVDPIEIAMLEFTRGVIPITVVRKENPTID